MRGFTLIEVLIAIFLLVVGIVGVMAMFPLGSKTVKSSQLASQASSLSQQKMEETLAKSYDDPMLSVGTTTEEYGTIIGFNSHKRVKRVVCVSSNDLSEAECDYDPVSDPTPMKKVEITVLWRSPFGAIEKSIKLASLVAKK